MTFQFYCSLALFISDKRSGLKFEFVLHLTLFIPMMLADCFLLATVLVGCSKIKSSSHSRSWFGFPVNVTHPRSSFHLPGKLPLWKQT